MSTIRDIARQAGVSVSTASLALNGDARVRDATRQRVVDAARLLDFHPSRAAKSLSKGRSYALHLLNPLSGGELSSSFFTRFVRGVHDVVHAQRYTLALTALDDEAEAEETLARLMKERWTDGVILMNTSEDERLLARLLAQDFPHVLLGSSARPGTRSVDSDNVAAAAGAAAHLIELQRGPILFLNGPERHAFTRERAEGYRRAHREAGREVNEVLIHFGLGTAEDARARVAGLLAGSVALSGVLASSDAVAVGALRALRDAGRRVPEDVALVGMNNDELCEYTDPRLSSVELNAYLLGQEAARLLLAAIAGEAPERKLVPHRLVVRDSSADPALTPQGKTGEHRA